MACRTSTTIASTLQQLQVRCNAIIHCKARGKIRLWLMLLIFYLWLLPLCRAAAAAYCLGYVQPAP
jgi:hypothetical protein